MGFNFFNKRNTTENYFEDILNDLFDEVQCEELELNETDEKLLSLEEFVVNIYTNQISIIQLLIKKGIITLDEYLNQKELTKKQPDIKELYEHLENRRKGE